MTEHHEVTILIVEDDPGHVTLIRRNLRRANIANNIVVVENGRLALEFVFSEGRFKGQQRPGRLLVLLDLNMPDTDGYEVLRRLKEDEETRRIPVIVLTTTDDAREVARCYDLGCNVYITKPVEYAEFTKAIQSLGLFLAVVTVPEEE